MPDAERAKALILAGKVKISGQQVQNAGQRVRADSEVELLQENPYVGRGAQKLLAALEAFQVNPSQRICADIGSSTGGFTDVLLQSGAEIVFAVDSAYGELDWRLRKDPRVRVMERCNALYLSGFDAPVDLVCVDVSLISLLKILPKLCDHVLPQADWITLIKPQYEAAREELPAGAVISDPRIHQQILERVLLSLHKLDFCLQGLIPSPIQGGKGNREFLAHFRRTATGSENFIQDSLRKLFEAV